MKVGLGFRNRLRGLLGPVGQEMDLLHQALVGWRESEHDVDGGHTDITADSFTGTGLTSFGGPWQVPEDAILTPPQIVANQNNYQPPGIAARIVLRLSTDASRTITGIVTDPRYDRWLRLINVGNFDLVLAHNSALSTQLYRIGCPLSTSITISSGGSLELYYDVHAGNWRVTGSAGAVTGVTTGSSPADAEYLVGAANGSLSAERVVTNTTSITWDLGTAAQAKAKRAALTGDATAAADSNALTLAASGVTAATYGDATHVPQIIVDAKGRITSATAIAITGGGGGSALSASGFYLDDGSQKYAPVFPVTPPVDAAFAWINQGTGTIASTGSYALHLNAPAVPVSVGTPDMRIRKRAAPATPYTITVWMRPKVANDNYTFVSFGFRESGSGKLHHLRYGYNGVFIQSVIRSTSPTLDSSTEFDIPWHFQHALCWRIADNGVNRIFSYSTDGENFIDWFTIGRTTFLTADEVFFAADTRTANFPAGVTLVSWVQA